jgi:hypothetical protein
MTSRKARPRPACNDGFSRRLPPSSRGNEVDAVDDYLAEIIVELEHLARANHKDMLAYLLSMAVAQVSARYRALMASKMVH